ncbi:hypothetical protein TA3x_001635 [Tundrisphaera sp. TA3]|uniref:hypothetical protein n=1 Tax=Tundrisphaera sp. TA3 TaxID=3435775 RepID=UPI003EB9489B
MNVTRSLTFVATPWSIALTVLVLGVTGALCFVAWRRSGYRRSVGLLEAIRFAAVAAGAVLLNQPEWVESFRPDERPSILVLWDGSGSMETRDVARAGAAAAPPTTRREAVAPLARPEAWKKLAETMKIIIQPITSGGAGRGTDLGDPLGKAPDAIPNLRGVVLASDGDWNEGQPPVLAATRLRTRGIPVFAVPVGSPTRLPDVELLGVDAPTFGVAGKAVRVPFTIDSAMPRPYVTTVTLRASDGDEVSREVRVEPMGRTVGDLTWKPKGTGDYTLTVDVPRHPDETLVDNNRLTVPIAIREEKLRVLVVESVPRWEYRYLRNALSRDPGIELSCLLFHPGLGKPGGGNKDYIKAFPKGIEELGKFDVVFLGDVGVEDGQLTAEDCRQLKGLVEHQASGLVFMPGGGGREFSLLETELGDLCPVVMDSSQPGGWGSRTPNHFELTETGRRSLLTKLADSADDNAQVWEGLPGFQWYAPVLRAKAGSEVLCVHKDASNESGRLPLLVTRTFGAGKVLFMGTDGAWRWRKGVEDLYHYRFWGQVVRWMAYQRNMAKGETMRLYYVPDQPRMDQSLTLHANVMEPSGEPVRQGDVSARITAPSGKAETVRFRTDGEEWGTFTGRYEPGEPGKHRITLSCAQTKATLEATFNVQGVAAERVGRPARPEVLEEVARVTKGRVVRADQADEIARSLADLPEPPPSVRRVQLWCHPAVAGSLVGLLGIFWAGRKAIGLI